ncbi:MAG: hypothetical protein ABH863_02335 [Candidatus Micrarchaeota archaeon]
MEHQESLDRIRYQAQYARRHIKATQRFLTDAASGKAVGLGENNISANIAGGLMRFLEIPPELEKRATDLTHNIHQLIATINDEVRPTQLIKNEGKSTRFITARRTESARMGKGEEIRSLLKEKIAIEKEYLRIVKNALRIHNQT